MVKDTKPGLMASGHGIFGRIADDGWVFVAVAGAVTILISLIYLPLGTFALGITLWFAHIMRMPQRQRSDNAFAILAPADGVIVDIADACYPSASLPQDDLADKAGMGKRLTIRTSLADMHWQCNPVSGRVLDNLLIPGQCKHLGGTDCFSHKPAFDRDVLAAIRTGNERREVRFLSETNAHVTLVQLATASAPQAHSSSRRSTPLPKPRPPTVAWVLTPLRILSQPQCSPFLMMFFYSFRICSITVLCICMCLVFVFV